MAKPIDRPDARMARPPCPVCNSHRSLTLFDRNIPCPACSAPERAPEGLEVHPCPECGQVESTAPGRPCGACRGRQLAHLVRNPASELLSLAEIARDREAH